MQISDAGKPSIPYLAPSTETRLDALQRAAHGGDDVDTAKQFETLFGVMLVRELRRAMPKGMFGEGAGADVYEGWFDEHLGNALAAHDALGIAGMVKAALGRAQAARDAQAALDAAAEGAQP